MSNKKYTWIKFTTDMGLECAYRIDGDSHVTKLVSKVPKGYYHSFVNDMNAYFEGTILPTLTPTTFKIYQREYDAPLLANNDPKPNALLGEFVMLENLSGNRIDEDYDGRWIVGGVGGSVDGKICLLEKNEVCGTNGGSKFTVTILQTLTRA